MEIGTGHILVGSSIALAVIWIATEIKTLRDSIPGNHITAVVRAAVMKEPGPFIWLAYSLGFLSGHLFWGGPK